MADNDQALSQVGQVQENENPSQETVSAATCAPQCGTETLAELRGRGAIAQGAGSVAVAGDVHGPIHTGTGNIIQNITQYIANPPPIETILRNTGDLFRRNRWLIGLTLVLQISLAALFFTFRDRFLLSNWIYIAVAALLAVAGWGWLKMIREHPRGATLRRSLLLVGMVTVAWFGLLTQQAWLAIHPTKFTEAQFGIAVANFGQGADNRSSKLGRDITGQLLNGLKSAIEQESGKPRIKHEFMRSPAATQIGIVRNETQAIEDGERFGAELVLWGKILEERTGSEIHFQALQAPDITDNPDFPQTLPIKTEMRSYIALTSTNPVEVGQAVGPQNATIIRYSLGLYYYLNQDFESAVDQFKLALNFARPSTAAPSLIDPAIIHYYLGRSYQSLEKYEEAQAALEEAERLAPDEPAIALAQAYNYRVMGLEEDRRLALQRAIDLCNDLPSDLVAAIYDRALAYEAKEDLEAALREYEAIVAERPDFFIAYLSSARLLARLGRFDEALARYQQARPLAEGQVAKQAWLNLDLGRLYEQKQQPEQALALYDQAIAVDPSLSRPYFVRAQLREKMGMTQGALHDYRKLIELSSQPHWTHEAFADYLSRIKQYPEAIEQYSKALRYPVYYDALTHTKLALAYANSDERTLPDKQSRAQTEFEKALRAPSPNEAYIRSEYGRALAGFGLIEEAIAQLERSIQADRNHHDAATMLNLGQLYESVGNLSSASALYEKVIAFEGQIDDIYVSLALERLADLVEKEEPIHEETPSP